MAIRRRWLRRMIRIALIVGLVVVLLVGGYAALVLVRRGQSVTLPAPTGNYRVGRTMFDWTDSTRVDPLAPRPGTQRELSVWLWYPTTATGPAAPYLPGDWSQLHIQGLSGLAESDFADVHDHAIAGAPVAAGTFPVVVLEPGLGLAAPQYTALAENLASHGYLVAGVTPTYSANITVLHNTVVAATSAGNPSDLGSGTAAGQAEGDRLVDLWAADARFAAARVTALDAGTDLLTGHVNPARTVYFGHSFGGAASLEACSADPRCAGAVDLDGAQFGNVARTGPHKPTLIMGSGNSCVTGACTPTDAESRAEQVTARTMLAASTGPTWCYAITGSLHFNFTDYATYYLARPLRYLVPLGSIDGDTGLAITNAYLTAFLAHVLTGTPEPLLTTATGPYSQVQPIRVPAS